jgi:cell division protein FtsL
MQLLFDLTLTFFFVIGLLFKFYRSVFNSLAKYEKTQYACLICIYVTCGINFIYIVVTTIMGTRKAIAAAKEDKAAREKQEAKDEQENKERIK